MNLLKKFEIEKCKEYATPMFTKCYLDCDDKRVDVNSTKYKGLIGSLCYLTTSKPNIMSMFVYVLKISLI